MFRIENKNDVNQIYENKQYHISFIFVKLTLNNNTEFTWSKLVNDN